jgi:hypothetical protein
MDEEISKKGCAEGPLPDAHPFFEYLSPLPYFREGEIKRGWVSNY